MRPHPRLAMFVPNLSIRPNMNMPADQEKIINSKKKSISNGPKLNMEKSNKGIVKSEVIKKTAEALKKPPIIWPVTNSVNVKGVINKLLKLFDHISQRAP